MRFFGLVSALALGLATTMPAHAQTIDAATKARIDRILKATPLIDGHNDLPEQLRDKYDLQVEATDVTANSNKLPKPMMTDMARLHAGRVGGQFWSVYISANVHGDAAIRMTLEQIDIVHRLIRKYPKDLELASTAADIVRIHKAGRIASLIGVEGGHQIGGSMAALRSFYALGARYLTLAHFKNNEVADSSNDDPLYGGLSEFGTAVVVELNRLGMLVDLSHVAPSTMRGALALSKAPVIFSHSEARALNDHPRNVPDDILKLVAANGGVVMVNFAPGYLSAPFLQRSAARAAEEARTKTLYPGQPDRVKAAVTAWEKANPTPVLGVGIVADHIDHIAKVAGYDNVGFGGDLDGIDDTVPGLDSVDGYPLIFAELIKRGWSDENLKKLAGGNILRALAKAETVAASMKDVPPSAAKPAPPKPAPAG